MGHQEIGISGLENWKIGENAKEAITESQIPQHPNIQILISRYPNSLINCR